MSARWLLCAATAVEARACRQGVKRAGAGDRIEVLQTGMGPARAERALREWLARAGSRRLEWVISTGFAGSRGEGLDVGSWILGARVAESSVAATELALEPWAGWLNQAGLKARASSVFTATQVAGEAQTHAGEAHPVAGKSALDFPASADCVDMESAALARVAREYALRFQIVRLISDTPTRPIPRAIFEFSALGDRIDRRARIAGLAQGIAALAREPIGFGRFIGQTMPLPKELARGWELLARHTESE